jgi:hypothetical protein
LTRCAPFEQPFRRRSPHAIERSIMTEIKLDSAIPVLRIYDIAKAKEF